jgi:hypothetical protein
MNKMRVAPLAAAAWLWAGSVAFADVQLSLQDGRVTLVAKDATVRQILTEWARIGQTKIVNVDRIPGGPVTLELTNVPEQEALDVLLRSLSGYMAATRANAAAGLSHFDRIVVMPTSAPPRAPVSAAPPPSFAQPQPQFVPPQFQPPQPDDDADEERPAPAVPVPTPRGPVFNTFPPPQPVNPQGNPGGAPGAYPQQPVQQQPASTPTAPFGGVAVPGMVVQPPPQPGQQVQPGQQPVVIPGQPPRRPGGPEGPEGQ